VVAFWLAAVCAGSRVTRIRRRTAGPAIVDNPPLASGERPLVIVQAPAGPVVATERALYHPSPAADGWIRLGWEQVGQVHCDTHLGSLVLTGWTPDAPARTVLAVPHNHALVALARERVAWTRLISAHVPLAGHGHAQVTARRRPGMHDLLWRVELDNGTPDYPAIRAEVNAAMACLRIELGDPTTAAGI
jgi:hypothetical protein